MFLYKVSFYIGEIMKQTKLNLIKEYKTYYTAKTIPEIVEIEEGKFLTIEGKGAPVVMNFNLRFPLYILMLIVLKCL